MNLKKLALAAVSISALMSASHGAKAAGFYIQEQSVKGLGYAFAGSATSIEDASTVYFNPAGMTKLDRMQINAGVHVIIPNGDLSDDGSTVPPFAGAPVGTDDGGNPYTATPIPNFYAVTPLRDNLWAGIGVSAPFGLGSDYGSTWFGRYDSTKTELKTINIQPSLAAKVYDWLSIGGGIDIQYADANLQSVAAVPGVGEGISRLTGDDLSLGYNIGFQADITPTTELGVHYRSAVNHDLDGNISFSGNTSPLADFTANGSAKLNLPDIATFGLAQDIGDKWRVMGQATWFGWNSFQDITARFANNVTASQVVQNYQTTWAYAIGAEYDWNEKLTIRGGYQFDETPTTDQFRTSRTPDGDRNWFSAGATYKLDDKIDLDFAATYIDVGNETINVTRNGGFANTRANTDGDVTILAVGLNYKF